MLHLLLVSIQMMILKMVQSDSKQDLITLKSTNIRKVNHPSNKDKDIILCHHCRRTSSNGIRCLGMCVADNDY